MLKLSLRELVDGKWLEWSSWSECSLSCGGGNSTRMRQCIGPFNGGKPCVGNVTENRLCNNQSCPGN